MVFTHDERQETRTDRRVAESDEIVLETAGRAGLITLNRPKALNALTHAMVNAMAEALAAWADDPAVERVVIGDERCSPWQGVATWIPFAARRRGATRRR